jgi:V8-like Glu-specific endopeptidase
MNRVGNSAVPPYNAIGLLHLEWDNGKTYTGSGCLIGASTVLTCAHNVIDQRPNKGKAIRIRFFSGWNSDHAPNGGTTGERYQYPPAYANGEDKWDIALIALASAPPINPAYYFTPTIGGEFLIDQELMLAGYPGNKNGEMWADLDEVNGIHVDTNTVLFTHDTYGGNSGSPLYIYEAVSDKVLQYAVHNSQNVKYGLRRGLLITKEVLSWITSGSDQWHQLSGRS